MRFKPRSHQGPGPFPSIRGKRLNVWFWTVKNIYGIVKPRLKCHRVAQSRDVTHFRRIKSPPRLCLAWMEFSVESTYVRWARGR